jgi:hypothetical protein
MEASPPSRCCCGGGGDGRLEGRGAAIRELPDIWIICLSVLGFFLTSQNYA